MAFHLSKFQYNKHFTFCQLNVLLHFLATRKKNQLLKLHFHATERKA